MTQLTDHFNSDEFLCPCLQCQMPGVKRVPIAMRLVEKLEEVRKVVGFSIHVNSGVRCYPHNLTINGSPTSSHPKGLAADIAFKNSADAFILLEAAIKAGFVRIGKYDTFFHFDVDSDKKQKVLW